MKFKSEKRFFSTFILSLLGVAFLYDLIFGKEIKWYLLFFVLIGILFYFFTYYELKNGYLNYRFGFLSGKINISDIKVIVAKPKTYYGFKYGLADNGLLIRYNKNQEKYISPKSKDLFIAEILKINPNILVTEQE